ncbi:hypothetical protein [Methylobacterium crusticola]|nr:hypothetical protein [Methylobacterium crusticola]
MTSPASAQTSQDGHQIIQLLLNAPDLQQYYHFAERPERVPLRVVNLSGTEVDGSGWTVAGEKAVLSSGKDPKALEISALELSGDTAVVKFAFGAEGLLGEGRFSRRGGTWAVDKVEVGER